MAICRSWSGTYFQYYSRSSSVQLEFFVKSSDGKTRRFLVDSEGGDLHLDPAISLWEEALADGSIEAVISTKEAGSDDGVMTCTKFVAHLGRARRGSR